MEACGINYESQYGEKRSQHAGDGRDANEVTGDRVLLPSEERVSTSAAIAGTRPTAVSQRLSIDVQLAAKLIGHGQVWLTYSPRSLPPLQW